LRVAQSLVTEGDGVGVRGERTGENLIVVGVAGHSGIDVGGNDQVGKARVVGDELGGGELGRSNAFGELLAPDHLGELGSERHAAVERDPFSARGVDELLRWAASEES